MWEFGATTTGLWAYQQGVINQQLILSQKLTELLQTKLLSAQVAVDFGAYLALVTKKVPVPSSIPGF